MHRVKAVAAMPPFRRIGLADHDRPRRPHPRNDQVIGLGYMIGVKRRAIGRAEAFGVQEILHRQRQAKQRAFRCHIVQRPRLCHDLVGIAQRDHRIHLRVHRSNAGQMRLHHLRRFHLAPGDQLREIESGASGEIHGSPVTMHSPEG